MVKELLHELQDALEKNKIAGFALLSHTGCVECAFGQITEDVWPKSPDIGSVSPLALEFLAAFGPNPPARFALKRGPRQVPSSLTVVRQEVNYVLAISRSRELSLSLHYLNYNSGVLAIIYARRQQASIGDFHARFAAP